MSKLNMDNGATSFVTFFGNSMLQLNETVPALGSTH